MSRTDESAKPEPEAPVDAITLEEWIAATQSCCGQEPESRRAAPASDDTATDDPAPAVE